MSAQLPNTNSHRPRASSKTLFAARLLFVLGPSPLVPQMVVVAHVCLKIGTPRGSGAATLQATATTNFTRSPSKRIRRISLHEADLQLPRRVAKLSSGPECSGPKHAASGLWRELPVLITRQKKVAVTRARARVPGSKLPRDQTLWGLGLIL